MHTSYTGTSSCTPSSVMLETPVLEFRQFKKRLIPSGTEGCCGQVVATTLYTEELEGPKEKMVLFKHAAEAKPPKIQFVVAGKGWERGEMWLEVWKDGGATAECVDFVSCVTGQNGQVR